MKNLHEMTRLPGFRVIRADTDADSADIYVEFGRIRRKCPHCGGELKRHGYSTKLCYDTPHKKFKRKYRIRVARYFCKSCRQTCTHDLGALPNSVVRIGKTVLATRRLRNHIGRQKHKSNYALQYELDLSWKLVNQIRSSINGRSG